MSDRFLFTSESVTEGHPDKIADQVSDAILDACLEQDPYSRVAAETLTATGLVVIAGEITTKAYVDFQSLVRGVVASIGYDNALYGFDSNTCAVISTINKQSGDIAQEQYASMKGVPTPTAKRIATRPGLHAAFPAQVHNNRWLPWCCCCTTIATMLYSLGIVYPCSDCDYSTFSRTFNMMSLILHLILAAVCQYK